MNDSDRIEILIEKGMVVLYSTPYERSNPE